jgi:hypothetical protein
VSGKVLCVRGDHVADALPPPHQPYRRDPGRAARERRRSGSGINSAAHEIGAALGIATIGTVLNPHTDLVPGMAVGYRTLAIVLAVLAVAVLAM